MNIFRKACITLAMIFAIQSSAVAKDDVGENLIITIGAGTAALIAAHAYLKNKQKKAKSSQSDDAGESQLFDEPGQGDANDSDSSLFQGNDPNEEYQDEIDTYDPGVGRVDVGDNVLAKNTTKELIANLAENGESKKKGCAAHHIVPQDENRPFAKLLMDEAVSVLKYCEIDIHSAENGVFLPHNKDPQCGGNNHRRLHTKIYYEQIFSDITQAAEIDCEEVHKTLSKIKDQLKAGTYRFI